MSHNGLKITPNKVIRGVGSSKTKVNILAQILSILLFVSLIIPLKTEAGVFSFLTDFFSGGKVDAKEEFLPNSQNMALLEARVSPSKGASSSTETKISIESGTSLLPESSSSGLFADGKDHSLESDQISLYVVRKGDTLPEIAKIFNVTTNTIVWANDLKGGVITVGQTLVIMPISGVRHIVKSGDTLESISKFYKGDLNEIMQYNDLTKSSKLALGDIVFIPDGEISSTPAKPSKNNSGVGRFGPSTPVYDGYYMRPIIGGIKTQGVHGQNGIDLASFHGSNILASASGEVIISRDGGWNGGYGSYVVLKHSNGTQTLYAHLSRAIVSAGSHVEQGDIIGRMGSTGKSTGTHLHFEIRGARNPF